MRTFSILAVAASIFFASCDGMEGVKVHMDQVYKFNDSLPTVVGSISSIQTRVDESEHVKVILGSATLYDAPKAKQQEVAIIAGHMALAIFGNDIKGGTLILTKDAENHTEDPADGLKTDMKLDSLKAAAGVKE